MLPDQVSNPGPLTYESGVLPIALRGPALLCVYICICIVSPTGEDKYRQCLRPIHWHMYILVCICCHDIVNK